jgi:hypothetical protein
MKLMGFLCLSFLLALVITYLLHRPSMRVIAQWSKPSKVKYERAFDAYYLSVVEMDIDWRTFPFHIERNYLIYVGIDKG